MQAARGAAVAADDVPVDVRARPATRWVWVTALVVLAADVVSKVLVVAKLSDRSPVHVIGHVLQLTVTRNGGAAFSVGTGATILFTAVAVVVVVIIARTARRLRSRAWAVAFGMLLGGALGNLSDRLFRSPGVFRGHVVDWIELPHWPIFNLADSAIVLGGVLAVLLSLLGVELDRSSR
ncbi:MAG TPA: signal peptidase II [Mycobacteriales bacterium]|jgi:signal peptidase II|nr:signal peptidase II [Mycobacteriales bacterium]